MSKIELITSKVLQRCHLFNLIENEFRLPTGKIVKRQIVEHPGAVVIIPKLTDNSLFMLHQYRAAIGQVLLEFPAGTIEREEEPIACAKRELAEETGHTANKWTELGILYPTPGFCSEIQYCFLAEELIPCTVEKDEDEIIEVISMRPEAIERAVIVGSLSDAKSIAVYTRAKLRGLIG